MEAQMSVERVVAKWLFENEYGESWNRRVGDPRWAGRIDESWDEATALLTLLPQREVEERAWRQGFRVGWWRAKKESTGSLTARNSHEDKDCPY
jgi:hypothetical protein